jgi:hypothetical protein
LQKITKAGRAGSMAQMVECLPSKALSPNPIQKRVREGGKERRKEGRKEGMSQGVKSQPERTPKLEQFEQ